MATDDDYMAFLNKANEDPMAGQAKTSGAEAKPRTFKTVDEGEEVPGVIREATRDAFYVSEADEPFVGVCLRWDEGGKGLPDEVEFAELIGHWDPENADIELEDPSDWNRGGEYGDIIDAVTKATKGADVRVYKVPRDGTRTEYFVVGCEGSGKSARLVGVKALSVET